MTDFKKFDSDKPKMSLIPPKAQLALARVLTLGAKKYGPDNWYRCTEPNRYLDAALRHINAWQCGEPHDKESKESHLIHAVASLMFLFELMEVPYVPVASSNPSDSPSSVEGPQSSSEAGVNSGLPSDSVYSLRR